MLVCCGNQVKKLIIDGGSYMIVVSSSMLECLKFLLEPYGVYGNSIMCNIIPLKVTHPSSSTLTP